MRIGIDYRFAARTNRGIGKYIREITRELTLLLDNTNEYILYVDEEVELNLPINFTRKVLPYKNILLFEQVYLPLQAKRDQLNILWYPSNSGSVFLNHRIKLVVTVHDMISFSNFNAVYEFSWASIKYRLGEYYRKFALRLGLKRIDQLLTVSKFSASEISKLLWREAVVVSNHISPLALTKLDDSILKRFNLQEGNYLFSMTGSAPHKNLRGLIELFSNPLIKEKLVISGVPMKDKQDVRSGEISEKVIFTGDITEEEKSSLYKHALGFLFLSYYEGFGIPLLEAMQFHKPVIASNRSSIPEVLGDGGFLVDPDDAETISLLITSLGNYDHERFSKLQDIQLDKFSSWRSSAEKMIAVFNKLVPQEVKTI